jgi:hypothetical protein
MGASAVGNAMPVVRLQGNAQSVIVCQVPPVPDPGASVFVNRIDCPWRTVGIDVALERSPAD